MNPPHHPIPAAGAAMRWERGLLVGALLLVLALQIPAARAGTDLNPELETMCQGLAMINDELGATAAPGTPMGQRMEKELALTTAHYGALWSQMKLTPTSTCTRLY